MSKLFTSLGRLAGCHGPGVLGPNISKPGGDYLRLFVNYLKLFVFQRLFGLFVDYLSKNVPFFRQDYLRLFEIVDYLHYLRLF